jgi:hypothetical protein
MDPQYQYYNHYQNYNQYTNYSNFPPTQVRQPYYTNTSNNNTQDYKEVEDVDEEADDENAWVLTDEAIALFAAGEERRRQSKYKNQLLIHDTRIHTNERVIRKEAARRRREKATRR